MIQVVEKFIQIHPQVVLIGRFSFRPILVVSLVERFRETAKYSRNRKAQSLVQISESRNISIIRTQPRYARNMTQDHIQLVFLSFCQLQRFRSTDTG